MYYMESGQNSKVNLILFDIFIPANYRDGGILARPLSAELGGGALGNSVAILIGRARPLSAALP